jgi:hypothetical protein
VAGYSGTPLPRKLGIKEGARVAVAGAPDGFIEDTLGALPAGAMIAEAVSGDTDVAILFVRSMAELIEAFPRARAWLAPTGGLWVAWPKKASGIATDLGENAIREAGLEAGLVDNKVCAIDDTWSGLRFVFRLKDRPPRA